MRNVPTAEYHIYGYFVIFLPILATNWLPWQCPLDPCNQKCLFWIGRPRKPPVISNHILAISCRNAFICIYSNFSPKIGCRGNAPLSLVYGGVRDEFTGGMHKPYLKTKLCMDMLHTTEVLAILVICGLFLPKFGCHGYAP